LAFGASAHHSCVVEVEGDRIERLRDLAEEGGAAALASDAPEPAGGPAEPKRG